MQIRGGIGVLAATQWSCTSVPLNRWPHRVSTVAAWSWTILVVLLLGSCCRWQLSLVLGNKVELVHSAQILWATTIRVSSRVLRGVRNVSLVLDSDGFHFVLD